MGSTHWGDCSARLGGACDCGYPAEPTERDDAAKLTAALERLVPDLMGAGVAVVSASAEIARTTRQLAEFSKATLDALERLLDLADANRGLKVQEKAGELGWPPPLANWPTWRHCEHQIKGGYCVHCGTKTETEQGEVDPITEADDAQYERDHIFDIPEEGEQA